MEKCSLCNGSLGFNMSAFNITESDVNVNLICDECQETLNPKVEVEDSNENIWDSIVGNDFALRMFYVGPNKEMTYRGIKNVKPFVKNDMNYVSCYCELRQELRTFRLDRIEELDIFADGVKVVSVTDEDDILKTLDIHREWELAQLEKAEEDDNNTWPELDDGDEDEDEDCDEDFWPDLEDDEDDEDDHLDCHCELPKASNETSLDLTKPETWNLLAQASGVDLTMWMAKENEKEKFDTAPLLYKLRDELERKISEGLSELEQDMKILIEKTCEGYRL